MENLRYRLSNFMQGRYGVDQLYRASFGLSFILLITNMFIQSSVVSILVWGILVWTSYRAFSKDIYKRQAENDKYLSFENKAKKKWSLTIRKFKEIRTHRFRKCPNCKTVMRLKRKRGIHMTNCPRCNNEVKVRILF